MVADNASQSSRTGRKPRKPICPSCEETIWDRQATLVCQCCKEWTHDVKRQRTPRRSWYGCYDSKRNQCQSCTEKEYKKYKEEERQKKGRWLGFHQWDELPQRTKEVVSELFDPSTGVDPGTSDPIMREELAHTLRELRLEARELGLKTSAKKKQMARAIVASFDSTSECFNSEDPELNGSVACKGDPT